jgi:DegV family protein with EDD domain
MKIAIMTDSNSGMTPHEAKKLGIFLLPMPFYVDDKMYLENIDLSHKDFFKMLSDNCEIHTSQPSPADLTSMWDEILQEYSKIIYLPMSSALSNSCQTAIALSKSVEYEGKVFVVDNKRISVTQYQACLDALKLVRLGKSVEYITNYLMETSLDCSIYIAIDDMKYLKKGGRVSPAAAGIATVLGIKPVLQIQGGKLDQFEKVRGMNAAKKAMISAIEKDIEIRFEKYYIHSKIKLAIAYAGDKSMVNDLETMLRKKYPQFDIMVVPLALSICCHTGEGALGVGCMKIL